MKKIYKLIILSIFLLEINVHAQDKVYGGLKAGINTSMFTTESKILKSNLGFSIAYFEVLELSSKINLQAEINYAITKFKTDSINAFTDKHNYKVASIDVPVMAKYRLSKDFAIGIGYQFGLKSNLTDEYGTTDPITTTNNGVKNSGLIIDASLKSKKSIFGLRVLSVNDPLITRYAKNTNNISFYFCYSLF
jgi:hypothetical protein